MSHADLVRGILDGNVYVVLATADADGVPWSTPVWFAQEDHAELYWVSAPDARHSRNLAVRPRLSMVVFDSTVRPNTGQAVYMSATAAQVRDPTDIERGMAVFSRVSVRQGLGEWGVDRVTGDARLRLYRASVAEYSILDPDATVDVRVTVSLEGVSDGSVRDPSDAP